MQIELRLPDRADEQMPARTYDSELDNIDSIFSDVTDFLGERGTFKVSGFGQDKWPVSVWKDLNVLLEQLPDALVAIDGNVPFEIDFYEQGVQRRVVFSPEETNGYVATCLSYGDWDPDPAVEHLDRDSLASMLLAVQDEFLRFLRSCCPDLVLHPWVQLWVRSTMKR